MSVSNTQFQPGAFDEAVKGVDAIAHAASPVSFAADDPKGDFFSNLFFKFVHS